jgi:hypothetical protein
MVLGQFSDICGPYIVHRSANIRKLAKDHEGYGSAAITKYAFTRLSIVSF